MAINTSASQAPVLQMGTSGDDILVAAPGGQVFGGQGDDILIGTSGGSLWGGQGNDIVIGGTGKQSNLLVGGLGQDTMTGRGTGENDFFYNTDPFDGKKPVLTPGAKIAGVNAPDTITDFDPSKDGFTLDAAVLGLKGFSFASGAVNDLKGGADVLVLQGQFANAGAAAQAIADNNSLTGGAGVFIYHNSTIGINRLVYSSDLGGGGSFSVLANMTNQGGDAGVALLSKYTANNFSLTGN